MASSFGTYEPKKDINTWISSIYCEKWGLKEGLRELIQNQRDELINLLGKDNIETQALNDYEFNFFKKGTNEIYGSIRYDQMGQKLSLENKGKLETFNLLLGGTTRNPSNNSAITGQFGEGLKIAAIALLRLSKSLSIVNTDQVWRFSLKDDENFIRNGQREKCLFWRWDPYNNPQRAGKVIVEIRNITIDEWKEAIDNYLWLVSKVKKLGIISAGNYGDIILNPEFKDRIYSRGVFVTRSGGVGFGYNLNLTLDRDRNCITDYKQFAEKANSIIFYILDNFNTLKASFGNFENMDYTEAEMFEQFPENIYNLLCSDAHFLSGYYYNWNYLPQKACDYIWEFTAQKKRTSDNRFNVTDLKNVPQPLGEKSVEYLQNFLRTKILPDNFYDYFTVPDSLYRILSKSKYYESYGTRFERKFKAKRIVQTQPNYEVNINNAVSKIQMFKPTFNRSKLVFREFESDEHYYYDNKEEKFYFSSLLFQNINKLEEFIFAKCLTMLGVSVERLLQRFRITPR